MLVSFAWKDCFKRIISDRSGAGLPSSLPVKQQGAILSDTDKSFAANPDKELPIADGSAPPAIDAKQVLRNPDARKLFLIAMVQHGFNSQRLIKERDYFLQRRSVTAPCQDEYAL
jgi:hypothetical protein